MALELPIRLPVIRRQQSDLSGWWWKGFTFLEEAFYG